MAKVFRKSCLWGLQLLVVVLLCSAPASANTLTTTSLVTGGIDGKGAANQRFDYDLGALSADGRFMVYASSTDNLVQNDTNENRDIFVYDRVAKTTERISVDGDGRQANNDSFASDISADGRYVAFVTLATNITTDDVSEGCTGCYNIFVHDRQTGQSLWANRNTAGLRLEANADKVGLSGDGSIVAFESDSQLGPNDTNNATDIAVRNLQTEVTTTASVEDNGHTIDGNSSHPDISADGRHVAFSVNDEIFVRDMQLGKSQLVSVTGDGHTAPGYSSRPGLSRDGRYVVFESTARLTPADTNQDYTRDIYERDLLTNRVYLISRSSGGAGANGSSFYPSVSHDGRLVTFTSDATNLTPADINGYTDVFVHYRDYGITRLVSRGSRDGAPARDSYSTLPSMSQDGKAIGFSSYATNLTPAQLRNEGLNFYLFYNPLVEIPYYDGADFMDLFFRH